VDSQELQWLPPDKLLLDYANPRLAGHSFSIDEQDEILLWLWRNKSVDELVDSVLSSGFWAHEELFAAEENGFVVVVEGNRRLAAVKLLTDPLLRARLKIEGIKNPSSDVLTTLDRLPVLVKSRQEIWQFIGFKHVNGPQEWDSIAKAEYISRVHLNYGVSLEEISSSIGDRHETVLRLHSGYLVLDQAKRQNLFDPEDAWAKRLPFSHLWTALGYTSVRNFLTVDSDSLRERNPVPLEKSAELANLLTWLFGSRKEDIEPKVRRQNPDLRDLARALESPAGIRVLNAGLPLEAAKEASLGDSRLFQDAITEAERALREAKRFVATGYRNEDDLFDKASQIETLARSLHREMKAQKSGDME
jgi:hypothetical protein